MTHSLIKSRTIFYRGNCMASVMMCDTAQAGVTPVFVGYETLFHVCLHGV